MSNLANYLPPTRTVPSVLPVRPVQADAELLQLRKLLLGRELELLECFALRLESLEQLGLRLEDPKHGMHRVSRVISEALLERAGQDKSLTPALEPLVEEIMQRSFNKRRSDLVNSLFPLMGPSIRKSIAESFRSMLSGFSRSMEYTFTLRGLRWRLEAWRSGKSFGDVVLLHTLAYRVEQIFFIHSETGLMLSQVQSEGAGAQDADMVSAMLTAIQDFVGDCFSNGASADLEALQFGESSILVEKTPLAYIACVVRGTPPADFGTQLCDTLDALLVEYDEALHAFNGDTALFTGADRFLEPCLITRYAEKYAKTPFWARALSAAVLLLLLCTFGYWQYGQYRDEAALAAHTASMRQAVNILRAEPGYMVVNVQENGREPWELIALKDELAPAPEAVLSKAGLAGLSGLSGVGASDFTFRIVPFISHEISVVRQRVEQAVLLPETVTMRIDDAGTVVLEGTATAAWIAAARETVLAMPGVKKVDLSQVRDPAMAEMSALIKEIEATVIEFPLGKDTPVPADAAKLAEAVERMVTLEKLAQNAGLSLSLTIYGHADTSGGDRRNYEISQSRTRMVAAMLYGQGSSIPVSMYGMGAHYPKEQLDSQASRRIEFRIHLVYPATVRPALN